MKYTVVKQGDDDWLFTVYSPTSRGSWLIDETIGEYEPENEDDYLTDILLEILPNFALVAQSLGFDKAPFVVLADLSDDGHLASFVDGSESHGAIFMIDPNPTKDLVDPTRFVEDSLYHELGHAYLRTLGIEYYPTEEDIVEEYALTRNSDVLDHYVEVMQEYV